MIAVPTRVRRTLVVFSATTILVVGAGPNALAAEFSLFGLLQNLLAPPAPAPAVPAAVPVELPATLLVEDNSYLRPVNGELMSPFGPRADGMHTGIDLRGTTGDPVRATRKGTIKSEPCGSGYGTCVMIDHGGGVTSLYAHLSRKAPNLGIADRGQIIGYVGCTGSCESPHVHFEIRENGSRRDPMNYLLPV